MANRMDISLGDAKIHIHRVGYKRYDEEKEVNTHLPVIAAAVRKHMHDRAVCALLFHRSDNYFHIFPTQSGCGFINVPHLGARRRADHRNFHVHSGTGRHNRLSV